MQEGRGYYDFESRVRDIRGQLSKTFSNLKTNGLKYGRAKFKLEIYTPSSEAIKIEFHPEIISIIKLILNKHRNEMPFKLIKPKYFQIEKNYIITAEEKGLSVLGTALQYLFKDISERINKRESRHLKWRSFLLPLVTEAFSDLKSCKYVSSEIQMSPRIDESTHTLDIKIGLNHERQIDFRQKLKLSGQDKEKITKSVIEFRDMVKKCLSK